MSRRLAINFTGFAAHWNKNSNLGQAFDVWFLNLFRARRPSSINDGGYLTLSFIPTLGTMILGLVAGEWFRARAPKFPCSKLLIAGACCIAARPAAPLHRHLPHRQAHLDARWTLFSGGVCFLFLPLSLWIIDVKGIAAGPSRWSWSA